MIAVTKQTARQLKQTMEEPQGPHYYHHMAACSPWLYKIQAARHDQHHMAPKLPVSGWILPLCWFNPTILSRHTLP